MLQFEELKLQLEGMEADIKDLANALGLDRMKMEIEQFVPEDYWEKEGIGWK